MNLSELLQQIKPGDASARDAARAHWDSLAKPIGSLGLLEEALEQIAALTNSAEIVLCPRAVCVFCADNGVVAQGVTQTGSEVTAQVAYQLAKKNTAVCRMAAQAQCDVVPVDVGIRDFAGFDGVMNARVMNGTNDFTSGNAMTRQQAEEALLTGARVAFLQKENGCRLLAAGEMGIGNTTTASAVACVLLEKDAAEMTGRGAGLSDEGLARKTGVIRKGIAVNKPDKGDVIDVLSKVGGLDLAAMCGLFLGGAACGIPVLIDGFPSAVAALCAIRLCETASDAVLASHVSAEPAACFVLDAIGKEPLITAGMRLGEGTGAVCAMALLDMALAVYNTGYTFAEGGIAPYKRI